MWNYYKRGLTLTQSGDTCFLYLLGGERKSVAGSEMLYIIGGNRIAPTRYLIR